jgi:hypothetical protein
MIGNILTGVGIYLGIGFATMLAFSFFDGARGNKTDIDTVGALLFWPLLLVSELLPPVWRAPTTLMKITNKAGLKVNKRRMARKHYRAQRKDFKALCKREGWPFHKMWRAQRNKLDAAR